MIVATLLCVNFAASQSTKSKLMKWASSGLMGVVLSSPFASIALAELVPSPWDPAIKYEVIKQAKEDSFQPKVGDLVAIRFAGSYKGNEFDNTFKTDQPYFYRAGVGLLVKGLDDSVVHMKVGDRYKLSFGGDLAFGQKGKPSSPGKPRIPPNAEVTFEVELVDLPGQGEDFIADYDAPVSDDGDNE